MLIKFFVLALCVLSALVPAKEQVLRYDPSGSSNWYPYYIPDAEHPGIVGELVPLILKRSGIEGEKIVLPAARMNRALENGVIDFDVLSPSWMKGEQRIGQFVFSEPILPIEEYIVTLASNSAVKDYKGKRVGTVRGYLYHDDDSFTRIDFSSEKQLVMALASKRIELTIIGKYPANYWSAQFNVPISFQTLHSRGMLHLRLRSEFSELLPRINQAISELKNEGAIEAMTNKYISSGEYH